MGGPRPTGPMGGPPAGGVRPGAPPNTGSLFGNNNVSDPLKK